MLPFHFGLHTIEERTAQNCNDKGVVRQSIATFFLLFGQTSFRWLHGGCREGLLPSLLTGESGIEKAFVRDKVAAIRDRPVGNRGIVIVLQNILDYFTC